MGTDVNPWDPRFELLVRTALERVRAELIASGSFLRPHVWSWMTRLSGSSRPEDYYLKLRSAPILLLPWWLERSLTPVPDTAFLADLTYATVNKYYSIRLVDDVMDRHGVDPLLLPMLSVWDAEFQSAYSRHFAPAHPFWQYFHQMLNRAAGATAQEYTFCNLDHARFLDLSVAKSCGATIAMMAVCYRRDRLDTFPVWVQFWHAFATWNQMRDDLFDCHRDLDGGIRSYLLGEGELRKGPEESIEEWFVREGFAWASELLNGWCQDMKEKAGQLNSPEVEQYIDLRAIDLDHQLTVLARGLESIAALSRLEL
jgi:hypothetical protein